MECWVYKHLKTKIVPHSQNSCCSVRIFYSDQDHTSNTRNFIDSIGYLCEQDLELTPPILPDRANLCGRGHSKIDQFHTNTHFSPLKFVNIVTLNQSLIVVIAFL